MSVIWSKLIRPMLFALEAERAHEIGVAALKLGLGFSRTSETFSEFGEIRRFGLKFPNPLGIAAGFDKNGIVVNQLGSLGFGFVEVGTVTFEPQPGYPRPRMFRLPDDLALINRLGFNNDGAEAVANRLDQLKRKCIVGINIGRNKNVRNEDATDNYLQCFERIHAAADYVAVNVSSPNTPDLRELQRAQSLDDLLRALQLKNSQLGAKPLLVKVAPDLSEQEIVVIVETGLRNNLSGIIATNTTVSRVGLYTRDAENIGLGGLSGKPLAAQSNRVISTIYRYSKGQIPIIGVGGIFSPQDAFEKIASGASLLQAYTGFVYAGPSFARDVNTGLADILSERGFSTLDEAVGSAHR